MLAVFAQRYTSFNKMLLTFNLLHYYDTDMAMTGIL